MNARRALSLGIVLTSLVVAGHVSAAVGATPGHLTQAVFTGRASESCGIAGQGSPYCDIALASTTCTSLGAAGGATNVANCNLTGTIHFVRDETQAGGATAFTCTAGSAETTFTTANGATAFDGTGSATLPGGTVRRAGTTTTHKSHLHFTTEVAVPGQAEVAIVHGHGLINACSGDAAGTIAGTVTYVHE